MIVGLRRLSGLHPDVRAAAQWALDVADYYGVSVTVTSGHRTWEEQTRLRARYEKCLREGRFPDTDCPYPANRPGDSAHNWGLAFDSVIPDDNPSWAQDWWDWLRNQIGFRVPANDRIHAEVPGWRGIVQGWPPPPR